MHVAVLHSCVSHVAMSVIITSVAVYAIAHAHIRSIYRDMKRRYRQTIEFINDIDYICSVRDLWVPSWTKERESQERLTQIYNTIIKLSTILLSV